LNILVLAVGRLRDKTIARLCENYLSRIDRPGSGISIEEIKEEPADREALQVLKKEADRLRCRLTQGAFIIALDREGELCDSPEFARRLNSVMNRGFNRLIFLIGGPLGLEKSLISGCDWVLSLSRMTFTHEMARLILLEQIYRAHTIMRGEPYHK